MSAIRKGLRRALEFVDVTAMRLSASALVLLRLLILVVIGGAAIWPLLHPDRLADVIGNKMTLAESNRSLLLVGVFTGSAAVLFALVSFILAWRRGVSITRTAQALQKGLACLAALPAVAMLRMTNVEKDWPKLTIFLVAAAAASVAVTAYCFPMRARPGRVPQSVRRVVAALMVCAAGAGYAFFVARLAITNHHALNTNIADLGYYDNIFYQSLHGRPLGCSFMKGGVHYSGHFDPILVILSPLYRIYPHAELLLVVQAVWLSSAVVPLYLLTVWLTKNRAIGVLLSLCLLAYPALHGANLYEFHSLSFIAPLVLWLLYFLERQKSLAYMLTLAALLLVREDVSLLMCFVGFYALRLETLKRARLGWVTIATSAAYFICVKLFIMKSADPLNSGDESISFAYYYADLIPNKNGLLGLFTTLVTNPVFVVRTALDEPKVIFIFSLFLPVAFLPFIVKRGRFMLVYGLTFCLLATRSAVFSTHFQYSSILFPIAFALVPGALERLRQSETIARYGGDGRRAVRAALGFVVMASVLMSWKFGGLVQNSSFRGGFAKVVRSLSEEQVANYAWVRQQTNILPESARVAATSRLGPHISNRKEAYFYPAKKKIDFALVDENELKKGDIETHQKNVSGGLLVEVARRGKLALFEARTPPAKEPERDPEEEP